MWETLDDYLNDLEKDKKDRYEAFLKRKAFSPAVPK